MSDAPITFAEKLDLQRKEWARQAEVETDYRALTPTKLTRPSIRPRLDLWTAATHSRSLACALTSSTWRPPRASRLRLLRMPSPLNATDRRCTTAILSTTQTLLDQAEQESMSTAHNLELWRRQRIKRKAKALLAEIRRKPMAIRPGGNDTTQFPRFTRAPILPVEPIAPPPAPLPVVKHVPPNTHRAGSIAYALLYAYWLPGA